MPNTTRPRTPTPTPLRGVALLRAINVGHARRVPMAELHALARGLGLDRVQTLLNSGNLVFSTPRSAAEATDTAWAGQHEAALAEALKTRFGFEVPVRVRSAPALQALLDTLPWPERAAQDPSRLLVALAPAGQPVPAAADLARTDWGAEAFHPAGDAAWLWCPAGVADSPLALAMARATGAAVTTRNLATLHRALAACHAPEAPGGPAAPRTRRAPSAR